MRVETHKLHDQQYGDQWEREIVDHWEYADFKADDAWRVGWISMDCALYNPDDDRVYLGITSFDADIFKAFDRATGEFADLGYGEIADPFDAKFHRSLVRGGDGCLYAAIALLHDVDHWFDAPGSPIVKYDPASGTITKLGVLEPHVYIQSMAIDVERGVLYAQCFPPEKWMAFDLKTGAVRDLGLIGTGIAGMAQGENIVLDDLGRVWGNWQVTRAWQSGAGADAARLCCYDPEEDEMTFFRGGLPNPDGVYGTVKAEALFNFGDGVLYASGANGSIFRVDPTSGAAEFMFTPTPDRPSRLSSMVKGEEGVAYGITGRGGQCEVLRFCYEDGTFEKVGQVVDRDGVPLWQCHDIVRAGDGTLFVCENDVPHRSGYLWEIRL